MLRRSLESSLFCMGIDMICNVCVGGGGVYTHVLFAIGPIFALEMPASYFIGPLFSMHFHHFIRNNIAVVRL